LNQELDELNDLLNCSLFGIIYAN